MKTMNQRMAEALDALMRERGLSNNELGRRAGIAPNTVANYRESEPEFTSKGKARSAKLSELELIAGALGIDPIALLGGEVRVAQSVSLDNATIPSQEPPTLVWRELKMKVLPPVFRVAMPDGAMAPAAEAGWVVEFETSDTAQPGDGVLVKDSSGGVYFRRFTQARGGGWEATPIDAAYLTLDSERDGLTVIAKLRHILRPKL